MAADTTEVVSQPAHGLSLRQNFAWTVLGNVVYAACQWGMLVALAKLGSPSLVGQFALGLALCAPVMMLANLQLRSVQATDARNEYRFGDYLALRLATTALAFAAICLIAWLAGYRWQTALVVILVGVAKSVESFSDVIYGLMQKYERLDRIAIAMMLRGVGSVIVFALALWFTRRVAWAAVALAGWWSAVLLTYERKTGGELLKAFGAADERFAPSWERGRMRRLAWLSLPLGVVTVLISLNTNIPRYFVEHYLGEAALGYFAALAYVMVAGYTVMNALGQSATPRLARYYQSNRAAFKRLLAKMMLVAAAVGAAGILVAVLWGRPLLALLYRPDYAEYHGLFILLMVSAGLSYVGSMLGYAITATRIYETFILPYAFVTIGTLAVCWLLIAKWGMSGAGLASCATGIMFIVAPLIIFRTIPRSRNGSPERHFD
jgi:O-antigen/teichoic acid export membrane protein